MEILYLELAGDAMREKSTQGIMQLKMELRHLRVIWLHVGLATFLSFLKILCLCFIILQCRMSLILLLLRFEVLHFFK